MKNGIQMSELWNRVVSWFPRVTARNKKDILYAFNAPILGNKRSVPFVIKGEIRWIVQFVPVSEFEELFGGYITWHPTNEIGETIGVWGKRNVSRFRRILRERKAEFDVVNSEGPTQRPWVVMTRGYTKKGRRMLHRNHDSPSELLTSEK